MNTITNASRPTEHARSSPPSARAREPATRLTEAALERVLDSAPVVLFVLDDAGVFTLSEGNGLRALGLQPGEVVGRSVFDVYSGQPEILEQARRALSGEEVTSNVRLGDAWFEVRWAPARTAHDALSGTIGIAIDVSENRRAEAALQASERRLRSIAEFAPEAIVSADASGNIIGWNRNAERMFGHKTEAVLGRPLTIIMPARSREAHRRGLQRFIAGGEARLLGRTVQVDGLRRDGSEFPLELSLSCWRTSEGTFFTGMMRDLTARKQAEAALARSESSFRALTESSLDGIAVLREGRFAYANPALVKYLGYVRADEIVGLRAMDPVHREDRSVAASQLGPVQGSVESRSLELRLLRSDGADVMAHVTAVPIAYDGEPAVLVTVRDVTERRKMQAQLRAADRLAMLGTLAAGVAHEITNPLAALVTNLELLARGLQTSNESELIETLRDAQEAAACVHSVVGDLKGLARADEERLDAVDVRQVLASTVKVCRAQIRSRAVVDVEYGDVPLVLANASRLGQVFLNLLVNAVQALPDRAVDQNRITIVCRAVGSTAIVEIGDNGAGISADLLERIFEPLFTTKPVGVGTGLGLSICRSIVTGFGGEIALASEIGRGSTFSIRLPATTTRAEPRSQRSPTEPDPKLLKRRVLLVDDDPVLRRTLRRALASTGCEVTLASSAREALAVLVLGERFDSIVSDLDMPGMSGVALHARVTELDAGQAARMSFIYGGATSSEVRDFVDRFPERSLTKPFAMDALLEVLRRD